jgi:hypothetical protein
VQRPLGGVHWRHCRGVRVHTQGGPEEYTHGVGMGAGSNRRPITSRYSIPSTHPLSLSLRFRFGHMTRRRPCSCHRASEKSRIPACMRAHAGATSFYRTDGRNGFSLSPAEQGSSTAADGSQDSSGQEARRGRKRSLMAGWGTGIHSRSGRANARAVGRSLPLLAPEHCCGEPAIIGAPESRPWGSIQCVDRHRRVSARRCASVL